MDMLPINNSFAGQNSYVELYLYGLPQLNGVLAQPTGGYTYQKGSLMCVYTSGAWIGQYGNYVSGASNGQGTCIGILSDDTLTYDQMINGGGMVTIQFGLIPNTQLLNSQLSVLTSGDIPLGMAELGARPYTSNGVELWYLP